LSTQTASIDRNRLIQLIHIGRHDLCMEEDTYRAILRAQTGHDSAADCSVPQLERVLGHLKSAGFKVKVRASAGAQRKGGNRAMADDDQSRMIRGIWLELHGMGIVRDASEAAMASFVCRHTKIEALQWLSSKQASSVIEHLKKWRNRILTERTHALWQALGLSLNPSLFELSAHQEKCLDASEAALGSRVNPIQQSQARFDQVLRTVERMKNGN
jgi:phage gp16-like protein